MPILEKMETDKTPFCAFFLSKVVLVFMTFRFPIKSLQKILVKLRFFLFTKRLRNH